MKTKSPEQVGDILQSIEVGQRPKTAPAPQPQASSSSRRPVRPAQTGAPRERNPQRRRRPADPNSTRYDHGLAEFPAFRFGKRRFANDEPLTFEDTIRNREGRGTLARRWTVYPSVKHGYGGASTQAVLFAIHQCWKESAFKGQRIYLHSLRHLYQMLHPGKNPGPKDYERLRRDLDILCGYEFDCENAFWEPVTQSYGTMRSWHLFTGWFEPRKRGSDSRQEEFPFTFIEVSETFHRIAQERGFFITGFDLEFFNSLRPVEQTLALYLSKMFVSQDVHRRYEETIFAALPIEGSSPKRSRQTLREAAQGLMDKNYPYLSAFKLEQGRGGRHLATFFRKDEIPQDYPTPTLSIESFPPEWREVFTEILRLTDDHGSLAMYAKAAKVLGIEAMRYAVADLRAEINQGAQIKKPGAWLTTKLFAMAEERGVSMQKHEGDRTPRNRRN